MTGNADNGSQKHHHYRERAGKVLDVHQGPAGGGPRNTARKGRPSTVFAPDDRASGTLIEGSLSDLLHSGEELRAAIGYHIVPRRIASRDISGRCSARTVTGKRIALRCGRSFTVNNASVILPDSECRDGIIHVIDAVLVPVAPG